ncbi:sulfotransferase 1B1-like [Gastrophryne carolinensis]
MASSSEWRQRELVYVRGVPLFWQFAENMDQVDKFQAREDDIVISTYPKSGTTWMSEIVDLILNDGDVQKSRRGPIFVRVPMLEFSLPGQFPSGTEILETVPSPRVIKTHLPLSLLPKSLLDKKTVYVARNPKDVAVSFYHFDKMNQMHRDPGAWEDYVERFMEGNVGGGSWSSHVREWWDHRRQGNVLYIFYEDMLEDPKHEIRKVAEFLGKDFSDDVLEKISLQTSFKAMKENPLTNYTAMPSTIMDHSISPFMRKGICGDWRNHFTEDQNKRFDEYYQREVAETGLTFRF